MEYYNFFDFSLLIQNVVYMLCDISYWLYMSVKFLFKNFLILICNTPWIQIFKHISSFAAFLASCIAIYAFLLRFVPYFRKIDFYTTEFNMERHKGFQLFVIIENKSLVSLALKRITLIVNNSFCIEIHKFNDPFILKPFETAKIGTGYVHSIMGPQGKFMTPMDFRGNHGLFLELYAKAKHQELWIDSDKNARNLPYISMRKATFNGIPYDSSVIYAVQYYLGEKNFLTFIDKYGICSKSISKYNQIPEPQLISADSVKNYLENQSIKWFGGKVSFCVTPLNEPIEKIISGVDDVSTKRTRP